ncbi:MAG: hypothetical protein IPM26_04945 [Saprospiraceae bacterium]|nr:hypothetical protein [Saprospiraceae bacterium]
MRLRITLEHKAGIILPWDYQYPVQEWIYRTLSKADTVLATMLHDAGYEWTGKGFKLFAFGRWTSMPYKAMGNTGMKLLAGQSQITVSFLLPEVLSAFVSGLFQGQSHVFYFRGATPLAIQVVGVEIESLPAFTDGSTRYSLLSGARISLNVEGRPQPLYVGPDYPQYADRILRNLLHKHNASCTEAERIGEAKDSSFNCISEVKTQKVNLVKDGNLIEMIGYKYNFELTAPAALHRVAYLAGVGEECSLGMGWVERME